jgi:hypothetical protein
VLRPRGATEMTAMAGCTASMNAAELDVIDP